MSMVLSCKIFEQFALQAGSSNWVHKLGSTPFKDGATLAPKIADPLSFWGSSSTPSKKYCWSRSTHILYYIKMLVRWNTLLKTRSCHVNKSFIIVLTWQHIRSLCVFIEWASNRKGWCKVQKTGTQNWSFGLSWKRGKKVFKRKNSNTFLTIFLISN